MENKYVLIPTVFKEIDIKKFNIADIFYKFSELKQKLSNIKHEGYEFDESKVRKKNNKLYLEVCWKCFEDKVISIVPEHNISDFSPNIRDDKVISKTKAIMVK